MSAIEQYFNKKVFIMLLLGFSAGIPILLIFSSLSLWLNEAGLKKSAVTMFSWAALGYSFKFIWAPLIDQLPTPWLTKVLGRRRSWLLISQFSIIFSILLMANINPAIGSGSLEYMAIAAVLLGFSSATQDIVIDAYRIECAPPEWQGILSSVYVAGYRIGMIVAGAGALYLASAFGSSKEIYSYNAWSNTYTLMAATMLVGVITTFIATEPENYNENKKQKSLPDNLSIFFIFLVSVILFVGFYRLIGPSIADLKISASKSTSGIFDPIFGVLFAGLKLILCLIVALIGGYIFSKFVVKRESIAKETWIEPIHDIFSRYGTSLALLLLCLVGFYRISDIVLGVTSNLFYQDIGFTKVQIAGAVKTYGVIITIIGSFVGGFAATKIGVMRTLLWGAILSAGTNLLFIALSKIGAEPIMLYFVVSADNLAAGFATAAFIAFLSSLTNISFTAVQYAVFSSIMTLFPKMLGGYSGSIVETIGYSWFFAVTTILGVPVIWLSLLAIKRLKN